MDAYELALRIEIVKMDAKDTGRPHLDWLIRGIEDPK